MNRMHVSTGLASRSPQEEGRAGAGRIARGSVGWSAGGWCWVIWALLWGAGGVCTMRGDFQGSTHVMGLDEGVLQYSKRASKGPIARLQERLDKGDVRLEYEPKLGYLRSLLKELGISTHSQMLVFSKTSFQRERINPQHPRALFYNDDVYVGYVHGSHLLEITEVEPVLGGVFYTLEQKTNGRPAFVRTDNCLECHASAKSMGVPGHLVRSFETDEIGVVDLLSGADEVNHRTSLSQRWGGWYVTGQHGSQVHRGNLVGKADFERQKKEPNFAGNVNSAQKFCDVEDYPAKTSDIVSLMVFEHQTHMHNFLTRLQYEARQKIEAYGHARYMKSMVEAFLKYLLFTEETTLTSPVSGDAGFVAAFEAAGPRDGQGRSLRDLDLKTRLFKYPCSYLIYSEAFDALPAMVKDMVYSRLWEVLSGQDQGEDWQRLTAKERREILEILVATKKGLPSSWTLDSAGAK